MADAPPCKNHLIHNYKFDELVLGTGSNQQPYFRALIFFNKKPEHSEEFFHDHWKSVHADLTLSVQNTGIKLSRYVQFHQDAHHRSLVAPVLESGHMQLLPYDGCAEFHCKDADKFLQFLKDISDDRSLVGCGSRFCDMSKGMHIMVGYDNLIMGDKSSVSGGVDGIMPTDSRLAM
ncbi:hypothetical protein B0J11DRAFT_602675 [Dendryphion nanum]|uniref:EthD domain-containing protein n=1 Tax=Dendryphion nanum TaxID=256645 RepID=A0A9P9ITB0_9PLEO|nr:hypothetical protein B0J11DRAFT_602675 [Dendryphion nanum]